MTDIWDEKPKPVWVPRGYYSMSKIKEDDIQMIILNEMNPWLDKVGRFIGNLENDIAELKFEIDELKKESPNCSDTPTEGEK